MSTRINCQATCANIIRLMIEKGFSYSDMQKKIGFISVQSIYKWKYIAEGNGHYKGLPSIDNLFLLANILNVSIYDIVEFEDS